MLGEYDKAIEAFNKAIAIDPNNKEAWFGKGEAFDKFGEYDKAIEAYDRAITIDPNYEGAKINRELAIKKMVEQRSTSPISNQINKWKMYCQKCGAELKEDSNFCGSCGFSQQEAIVKEEKKGIIGQFLELFKLSFNWSGRFSRRQFVTYNVGIFFIVFSITLLIVLTGLHVQFGSTVWVDVVLLTLVAIGQISNSIAVIRRLHDLDKSGWYFLLIYIPIVLGVLFLIFFYVCYIYLLVKKGKEIGETRWG